jgi:hypothetical protein
MFSQKVQNDVFSNTASLWSEDNYFSPCHLKQLVVLFFFIFEQNSFLKILDYLESNKNKLSTGTCNGPNNAQNCHF